MLFLDLDMIVTRTLDCEHSVTPLLEHQEVEVSTTFDEAVDIVDTFELEVF